MMGTSMNYKRATKRKRTFGRSVLTIRRKDERVWFRPDVLTRVAAVVRGGRRHSADRDRPAAALRADLVVDYLVWVAVDGHCAPLWTAARSYRGSQSLSRLRGLPIVSCPTVPRWLSWRWPCAVKQTARRHEHGRPSMRPASTGRRRLGCGYRAVQRAWRPARSPRA